MISSFTLYVFFVKKCFAVFGVQKHQTLIRTSCKISPSRYDVFIRLLFTHIILTYRKHDEMKPLLASGTPPLKYQRIITIPYAHVIRDDKIQYETSHVIEANATDTYLLFDGMIPGQDYNAGMYHIHL